MPRRSSATAETLERQDAEDGQIEDDESWRDQTIPNFTDPPKTHAEQLADLDARDERLNGQPEGVRPSEQCGVLAGSGPYPGKRCTYAAHPMDQPHSWEVFDDPEAPPPGHVYSDEDQPTLPGTPEPETDAYSIPFEGQFNNADFMAAPGVQEIAERYIETESEFEHLVGIKIRYFWKRRDMKCSNFECRGPLIEITG